MEWKYDASACTLCPRGCGVDRLHGVRGRCGCDSEIYVARAALHMWEEPCISGNRGSGTVFFSGCPLGCVFCQNANIANAKVGKKISVERLSEIFLEQQDRGALNINLVTPTHYIPQIVKALEIAKSHGLKLPVVYNTGGYEKVEALRMLDGLVDVYLPDMKYMSSELAGEYSHATDYPQVAKAALAEMFRQVGKPVFQEESKLEVPGCDGAMNDSDRKNIAESIALQYGGAHGEAGTLVQTEELESTDEDGLIMTRGMIVRHLVLPGCTSDSKAVIKYLYDTFGDDIYMSIMSQYTPMPQFLPGGSMHDRYPELGRCLTDKEYDEVVDYAIALGVENAFIQEGDVAKDSFIPDFDALSGV